MAAVTTSGFDGFVAPAPARAETPSLFARFIRSVVRARQLQAERQIARMIETKGGRLTDDIERQIARDFI